MSSDPTTVYKSAIKLQLYKDRDKDWIGLIKTSIQLDSLEELAGWCRIGENTGLHEMALNFLSISVKFEVSKRFH